MKFKTREDVVPKIECIQEEWCPIVYVSEVALNKMFEYVNQCTFEIGWLGSVERFEDTFLVKDVYLITQESNAVTCELTTSGLEDFASELLLEENGVDLWNSIKLWGHSHVNMSVGGSGQDDKQMTEFSENAWFLRVIANKKGEMEFVLYDFENNLLYENLPWEVELSPEVKQIHDNILLLQKQMSEIINKNAEPVKEDVKREIKDKVTELHYVQKHNANVQTQSGYWYNGVFYPNYSKYSTNNTKKDVEKHSKESIKLIDDDSDIYKYFDYGDLVDISYSEDFQEACEYMLEYAGIDFSTVDMKRIYEKACDLAGIEYTYINSKGEITSQKEA